MEKLSSAILDKVKADARGIIKEAEEKAGARVESARAEQRAKLEAEKSRLMSEASTEASRILAQASIKARQELLSAQTKIIDEIISEVKKSLSTLPESEKLLTGLIWEGITTLSADKVRVYVAPKDLATMQKLVKGDRELGSKVVEIKGRELLGGVIVEDLAGRNRVDNTFETRLEMLLPKLLPEMGKELF